MSENFISKDLERRMDLAQRASSMILSIRKKENIRVRQPLQLAKIPVTGEQQHNDLVKVKDLICSEVNLKQLELVSDSEIEVVKNLKLNFKTLGKKCGKWMKQFQDFAAANSAIIISAMETEGAFHWEIQDFSVDVSAEDVEIVAVDIPGWKVMNQGNLTVALDITLSPALLEEGIARELVNRIQNLRKERGFEVTDKINISLQNQPELMQAVNNNLDYICAETLAMSLTWHNEISGNDAVLVDILENQASKILINKLQ
jgi:isoleucyl-tRNA synthetase